MTDPVSSTVDTIQDNLDQGIFDWDVTHGELIDNNQAIAELTPQQRNEAIAQLSDDDLENWAQEINGLSGDLSASERQDLFNQLAEGLDAEQLARVVNAFEGDAGSVRDFGNAVADHASAEAKVGFVQEIQGGINGDYDVGDGHYGSAEALATGVVLGSLSNDPAALGQAIDGLSDSQLTAVLEAGLGRHYIAAGRSYSTFLDPSVTTAVLDAVAGSQDAQLKARVFEIGVEQIGTLRENTLNPVGEDGAVEQLTGSLNNIIDSDPNGVVTQLRTNFDVTGETMTAYNKELLASGNETQVRELIIQLQQGNDAQANAYRNFEQPGVAYNVGYYTGSTAAAINEITGDAEAQANMIKNIFGTAFGVAGTAGPAAGVIASVGNGITSATIDSIVSDVANDNKDVKQALYELSIPRGPDNQINADGDAYGDFNAVFAAIAEVNR